jgi:FAD/FMN-containing dehydrogenase
MMSASNNESDINWFDDRTWSVSGNKVEQLGRIKEEESSSQHNQRKEAVVLFPTSTLEISQYLSSKNNHHAPIAVVCGGHSSSNVATWPIFVNDVHNEGNDEMQQSHRPIILDMKHMSSMSVNRETLEVTVGGGVLFRQLAETISEAKCALPIGTGPTVGVSGYVVNGGISGYFGRRLGMLGQRVTKLEMVLANGDVKTLVPPRNDDYKDDDNDHLFRACLGAGSAMGVVTSLTLKMEKDSIFRTGGSIVFACSSMSIAKTFLRKALLFMKESVLLPPPSQSSPSSSSMEIVTTSDFTVICTLMFYDSFDGDPETFVAPLRDAAKECNIPIVADGVSSHKTWFDAASSLWGVIDGMKGSPLVRMDHCMGTEDIPSDEVLDFLLDTWFGGFLEKALLTIIEIRTLGGAAASSNVPVLLPTTNVKCTFFADMIVSYDASTVTTEEQASILADVHDVIAEAKKRSDIIMVDFSGTHGQSDDPLMLLPDGEEVFGGREKHDFIRATKKKYDPNNRFRYHPFVNMV